MVAVAENQVGEVALVPLVEEAGIVVLRLLTSPHIERFVHHDQSHRIAHIEQFGCWRIMRAADRIHTHRLEFGKFAVEGIFIQCCTQATKVVVLANTIKFEVLAIEPEARLGIELKVAEACGGLYFIDHLTCYEQLRAYLIYIGVFAAPLS